MHTNTSAEDVAHAQTQRNGPEINVTTCWSNDDDDDDDDDDNDHQLSPLDDNV